MIKLLLIEDNKADARFIEILLEEVPDMSFEIKNTTTFQEGIDELQNNDYDLVLLDLSLPDSFGMDTIKNAAHKAPLTPIIVLTGRDDEDFGLEVVKAGAQDYLIKGRIDSALLNRGIKYAIERKELEVTLKKSNKRLEESENRLNTIVTFNISGILVLDKQGIIKYVNPAAEKILGQDFSALQGQKFQYQYSLNSATLFSPENSVLQVEVLAVETEWGGEESVLLTLHDITELMKAEKSLREKNAELTRINKALDRFVYIISHDLKKPTANIIGLLSLYEKDLIQSNPTKGKTVFEKLSFSAMQLKKMIEDLLEATKREISTDMNFELIDFKKIFNEVMSTMDQIIAKENAEINIDFSGGQIVYYSYQELKSILSNLLSNALKFHPLDKKPVITIKTDKSPKGTVLIFSDNGIGIDLKKNRDKLFQKYERINKQTEGTGLGLWIIKEIVEKNGGNIEVESESGKGTTFKIYFS